MSLPETIGKYRVVGRIGSGAMGEVYKAYDPILNRHVALKTMSAEFGNDPELRKRFEREAQSAARLTHPHIVTVYELGEEAGHTFIAMELLEGQDLKALLGGPELGPLEAKLRVMDQVSDGLAFAHAREVVHRDLKPANIRVLPNGTLKIMDFGLARLGQSEMTRAGMVLGTPHYMSPEQVRGQRVDARSDVFSLGAVFYELLTGTKAFEARSLHSILHKVVDEQPPAITAMNGSVPAPIAAVVEKALQKDPAQRFANAGEMRDALRAAGERLGVSLAGETWSGRALDDAPTVLDGAPSPAHTVVHARSVAGATALDVAPALQPATRAGAPATVRGSRTTRGAPAPAAAPPRTSPVLPLTGLGLLLLVGAGAAYWYRSTQVQTAGQPDVRQAQQGVLREALVENRIELARDDLANKEYASAIKQAEQALAVDPQNVEARELVERARATQRECEQVAGAAQEALKRGDTGEAGARLSRLLALDPRHAAVGALTEALNSHFRSQAEEARRAMAAARDAARAQAGAAEGFGRAEQLGRQAETLMAGGEFAVATQRFTEARDGFERAQRAAELLARKAAEAARVPATTLPPVIVARATPVELRPTPPPSLAPVNVPSLPAVQATPGPTAPPTPAAGGGQESAVRAVIADYARAISNKDVGLFRNVKPNLSDADAKRLQEGFKASKLQQVQIQIQRIESDGHTATVRASRQDTIDGRATRSVQQSFRLVLTPAGWKIETIGQ